MFPTRRITTSGGDVFRDEFSLAFDGSNDNLGIGNPTFLKLGTADISFSIWYKPTADNGYIISKRDGDNGQFSIFHQSNGKHRFYIGTVSATGSDFGSAIELGVWNHLVMVYDDSAGSVTKYVNGKFDAVDTSLSSANVDDNQAWRINGRYGDGDEMVGNSDPTECSISEVTIYNKTLSASEVKTIYNSREPYNHKEGVCSSNLKAWWRMGDGSLDDFQLTSGLIVNEVNPTLGNDTIGGLDFQTNYTVENATNCSISDANTIVVSNDASGVYETSGQDIIGACYKVYISGNKTANTFYYRNAGDRQIYYTFTGSSFAQSFYYVATHSQAYFQMSGPATLNIGSYTKQLVGAGAAPMNNMTATDFVGDTP